MFGSSWSEATLSSWLQEGIQLIPMTSSRYPAALWDLVDPPPLLFLRGEASLLHGPSVAIVGSRKASEAGRRTAEALGRVLAGAGVVVVSGMALGIDGAAHRGALEGGWRTAAVLGSGLNKIYPVAHRSLARTIAGQGVLVSEFLPREEARPHHFPRRNRIIAALARAIIVVEAGRKSGALITVDHGLDLGREIFVTPGSVENPQARGSNRLLREGARALADPSTVLEDLRGLGFDAVPGLGEGAGPQADDAVIPPELRTIWSTLSTQPKGVEEVARSASLSVSEALAGLAALELGGWARQCPGMRFQRT